MSKEVKENEDLQVTKEVEVNENFGNQFNFNNMFLENLPLSFNANIPNRCL